MSEQPKYSKGEELMEELSKKFEKAGEPDKAIAVAETVENEALLNVLKKNKVGDPELMSDEEKNTAIELSASMFKALDQKNYNKTKVEVSNLFEEFRTLKDDFIKELQKEIVKSAFTPRQVYLEKLWQYLTENF